MNLTTDDIDPAMVSRIMRGYGKTGGSKTSAAKTAANRRNGALAGIAALIRSAKPMTRERRRRLAELKRGLR